MLEIGFSGLLLITVFAAVISFIQFKYVNCEYPSIDLPSRFMEWHLQHDEKISIPDARCFYLKKAGKIADLMDYKPYPVSAAFGIAVPLIIFRGFNAFGLTNKGLRFFFIIISCLTNLLFCYVVMKMTCFPVGILMGSIYCFNVNNLILGRSAIHENILTLILVGAVFCQVCFPEILVDYIFIFAFIIGATILVKPNFFVYTTLFFLSFCLFKMPDIKNVNHIIISFLAGFVFFEGFQLIVLHKFGVLKWRYINLLYSIQYHSGKGDGKFQIFRPDYFQVIHKVFSIFLEWYKIPRVKVLNDFSKKLAVGLIGIIAVWVVWATGFDKLSQGSGILFQLLVFFVLFIVSLFPFYISIKRFVSIFPIIILISGMFIQFIFNVLNDNVLDILNIIIAVFIPFYIYSNLKQLYTFHKSRDFGVQLNSRMLEDSLPENSTIYTHCYGYRFFWQVKKHRLCSADDQIQDNKMIIERALAEDGRYILLSQRGGLIDMSFCENMAFIKSFQTGNAESGIDDIYSLYDLKADRHCPQYDDDLLKNNLFFQDKSDFKTLTSDLQNRQWSSPHNQVIPKLLRGIACYKLVAKALSAGKPFLMLPVNDCSVDSAFFEYVKRIPKEFISGKALFLDDSMGLFEVTAGVDALDMNEAIVYEALYKIASHLKLEGNMSEAEDLFTHLEKNEFYLDGTCFHLGEIAFHLKDYSKAVKAFTKSLKFNPFHRKSAHWLVKLEKTVENQ